MRSIGHSSDHQHDKSSRQQQAQRPVPISIHRRERLLGKTAAPHLKIGSHAADYVLERSLHLPMSALGH